MTKWGLPQECKSGSTFGKQSVQFTVMTDHRITIGSSQGMLRDPLPDLLCRSLAVSIGEVLPRQLLAGIWHRCVQLWAGVSGPAQALLS